jgi:hypothetical protein
VDIQKRLLKFVTRSNWVLFVVFSLGGWLLATPGFTRGVFFGGLLVTVNFHLLARTIKKALTPPYLSSHNVVLAKYYMRFIASGVIIFILITGHFVHPLGLIVGLSVVVASIFLATLLEVKNLFLKEAV